MERPLRHGIFDQNPPDCFDSLERHLRTPTVRQETIVFEAALKAHLVFLGFRRSHSFG